MLSGLIGSDSVQVSAITGTFQTKNVGNNIPIGTGTVVLSGADAMDYTLIQPTNLSADITPRPLTVSAAATPPTGPVAVRGAPALDPRSTRYVLSLWRAAVH